MPEAIDKMVFEHVVKVGYPWLLQWEIWAISTGNGSLGDLETAQWSPANILFHTHSCPLHFYACHPRSGRNTYRTPPGTTFRTPLHLLGFPVVSCSFSTQLSTEYHVYLFKNRCAKLNDHFPALFFIVSQQGTTVMVSCNLSHGQMPVVNCFSQVFPWFSHGG